MAYPVPQSEPMSPAVGPAAGLHRPPLGKAVRRFTPPPPDPLNESAAEVTVRNKPPTHLSAGQILDATAVCLRTRGYDDTTVRCITRELDCAVGSIYRYFKGKRALLLATVERRFEATVERAEARDDVAAVAGEYSRLASGELEQYRLMFWLASVGHDEAGTALPTTVRRLIAAWSAQLGDAAAAEARWAAVHTAVILGKAGDGWAVATARGPAGAEGAEAEGTGGLGARAGLAASEAEELTLL